MPEREGMPCGLGQGQVRPLQGAFPSICNQPGVSAVWHLHARSLALELIRAGVGSEPCFLLTV